MSTTPLIPDAQIIQLMPDPDHPVSHVEDESPAIVGTGYSPREALDAALLQIKTRS